MSRKYPCHVVCSLLSLSISIPLDLCIVRARAHMHSPRVARILSASVQEMLGGDECVLADYEAHFPKCFVVSVEATDTAHPAACLFSSYSVSRASAHLPGARHVKRVTTAPLWVAARATSAAPTFFPPCIYTGRAFIDGGLLNNNPSNHAVAEAARLFPHRPIILVSLGCGEEEPTPFRGDKVDAKWRSSEARVNSASANATPVTTPRSGRGRDSAVGAAAVAGHEEDELSFDSSGDDAPEPRRISTQTHVWGPGAEVEAQLGGKACWFDATVVRFFLVDGAPQVRSGAHSRRPILLRPLPIAHLQLTPYYGLFSCA